MLPIFLKVVYLYVDITEINIFIMEKIIGLINAPFTPFYANGEVNYVEDNGILTITDNGSPINISIDDPYIYPSEGFYYCPHYTEDISDTITSLSASATSENLWYLCPYDYCSREVRPYGYLITGNGQFNF